jgi:perosamine synthetase
LLYDGNAGNAFAVVLLNEHRDYLYTYLRDNGIGAGKHFQHAREWVGQFGYQPGECPNFEQLIDTVLTIPCHYGLSQRDVDKINQCLHNYVR